ncbi:MAG: dihydrodipicolinate synthase family protein [Oscillospiraceae bacterium]|nr:dihydrodipicolinate synthase family protein [Oscillospiraceae bacterium]
MYYPFGILPAMITPMHEDESLNLPALRAQTRRFLNSRVHGLFCLGTNGEFYVLSKEEKIEVMKTVLDEAAGEKPVCVGAGCVTTRETVELAQTAQRLGASAVSIITPYFGQAGQQELVNHYRSVASSVDIGVILYNIPARTGNAITCKTLENLAAVPNIVAIKDSSGNFDNMLQYLEATGREFAVLSGNDSLILSALQAGGVGGIAGTGNLFPNKMADIYNYFQAGDVKAAAAIQDGIRPMRNCLSLGNPNSVIKRAAHLLGHEVGPVRRPFEGDYGQWDTVLTDCLNAYYSDWN